MNRSQYFSETINNSLTIDKNSDPDFSANKSNKLILSISCLVIAAAPSSNIRIFEDTSGLTFDEHNKKTAILENTTITTSSKNFSSYNQKGDTLEMNNGKLEVDDLVERVTQAQIDEIKSHFDTKILNLEEKISKEIDRVVNKSTTDLKDFINKGNEDIKKEKVNKLQFFIGSIVVPLVTVLLTLLGTKYFGSF